MSDRPVQYRPVYGAPPVPGSRAGRLPVAEELRKVTGERDEAVAMLAEILDFIRGGLPRASGEPADYDLCADSANYLLDAMDDIEKIVNKAKP